VSINSFLFGNSGSSQKQSVQAPQLNPVQSPFLKSGWQQAQNTLNSQMSTPWYQGPTFAGLNSTQMQGINNATNFATGAGHGMADASGSASMANVNAGSLFGSNAQDLYNKSLVDPTQSIIDNAGKYAANPFADGMIDSASRDIARSLGEDVIPGIQGANINAGGINSSRAGAMEAVATRGAADRIGDISSNIRGGLFNTGLGMSQAQHNQGMTDALNANSQIGSAYANGINGLGAAHQMNFANADALASAGGQLQQNAQGQMDADFSTWNNQQQFPWQKLSNYMGVIGGGSPVAGGITTTQGAPASNGNLGGILGAGATALGAYYGAQ